MTFKYEVDPYSRELHRMCKFELPMSRLSKVIGRRGATGRAQGGFSPPPRRGTLAPRRGILVFFVGDDHWPYDNVS